MAEEVLKRFGYPGTLIKEYDRWVLLLRPKQVTLGSLILLCRDPAEAFSEISHESFVELAYIIPELERNLKRSFAYDKINYLMLMMGDPVVHFHVIPRYEATRDFEGITFKDVGWPRAPNLEVVNETSGDMAMELINHIRAPFNERKTI